MTHRGASWFPSEDEREYREARTVETLARAKADRSAERAERVISTWLESALTPPKNRPPRPDEVQHP